MIEPNIGPGVEGGGEGFEDMDEYLEGAEVPVLQIPRSPEFGQPEAPLPTGDDPQNTLLKR